MKYLSTLTICLSSLLLGGCTEAVVPPELRAVLDDPSFSKTAEVIHQGNLENLAGCWGSFRVVDGWTDAVFVQYGEDGTWTYMMFSSFKGIEFVAVEQGTYEILDGDTVRVEFIGGSATDPYTGALVPDESMPTFERQYKVSLQNSAMEFFAPAVDAPQYDETLWRFEICP